MCVIDSVGGQAADIDKHNEEQQAELQRRLIDYKDRLLVEHESDPSWAMDHQITALVSLEIEINDDGAGCVQRE